MSLRVWSQTGALSFARPKAQVRTLLDEATTEQLGRFAGVLATDGVARGLIGPREVDRLWDRHLLNCAVAVDAVPRETSVIDVGSGAGLPGLVWAIVRPDLLVTCVEPLLRRATFLTEVVERLNLTDRVQVRRGRAEELSGDLQAPVVTARAVAPLDKLVSWTMPLVVPGGELLALKGAGAEQEVTDARAAIARWGGEQVEISEWGSGIVNPPTRVVRIKKSATWR